LDFLYNLIIFPITQIIELIFLFIYRIFRNTGISIIGVSAAVSVITLPFYFFAEKIQRNERGLQNKLKPKIKNIKEVFKGDEQFMILSTYYRQNNYHPLYALRNSLNLIIQIPFFIAAYIFLTRLQILNGVSFLFISDLGKPDLLLSLNNLNINILPIIMTLINIASAAIYTNGFGLSEKAQLYGMSFIFLVLLYNAPSALVLYWTMNNLFSLGKNIIQKVKKLKITLFILLYSLITAIIIYLLFFHPGDLPKRLLAAIMFSFVILIPAIIKIIKTAVFQPLFKEIKPVYLPSYVYFLSCIILFLLNGIIIPSSLIASSVIEFSFIDNYSSPFHFILRTLLQSAGFFILWPIIIYYLLNDNIRNIISYIMVIICAAAIINVFTITENFGFLTITMVFSEPKPFNLIPRFYILNIIFICLTTALILLLLLINKKIILVSLQIIVLTSFLILIIYNSSVINSHYNAALSQKLSENNNQNNNEIEYTFSTSGKNVLLIMLDSAVGGYIPEIFNEKPRLYDSMRGFRYYSNTVSYANHTLIGALPLFGGYEYTPDAINKKDDISLIEKQKEAYHLLPSIFHNAGFSITISDPPFDNFMMSNLSIFDEFPEYDVKNLSGKYTSRWLKDKNDIDIINISELLDSNLIRFSFYKCAPLFLRLIIYDKGNWLKVKNESNNQLTYAVINDYAFLDSLDKITGFKNSGNTYTAIKSRLPHDFTFLQAPDYTPSQQVTNRGSSIFASDPTYHLTIASLLLLEKWFIYLKENDVYDNTRIIIVSDHGRGSINVQNNIRLPNGSSLFTYNSLLLVKDFYSYDDFEEYTNFMTNADVPLLALDRLIENPVNPFTNNPIKSDKNDGIYLTTIGAVSTYRHGKFTYNIGRDQWLFVKDNIFDPENWRSVIK